MISIALSLDDNLTIDLDAQDEDVLLRVFDHVIDKLTGPKPEWVQKPLIEPLTEEQLADVRAALRNLEKEGAVYGDA